jgi:hypothetical protein
MGAATGLDDLLDPLSRSLDAESAQRLVDFSVDLPVQERINTLAERANDGKSLAALSFLSLRSHREIGLLLYC